VTSTGTGTVDVAVCDGVTVIGESDEAGVFDLLVKAGANRYISAPRRAATSTRRGSSGVERARDPRRGRRAVSQ